MGGGYCGSEGEGMTGVFTQQAQRIEKMSLPVFFRVVFIADLLTIW
jgi:hypothetical protein